MTQYAVLNYYYNSKIALAIMLYISIHKLTWKNHGSAYLFWQMR